MRTVFAGTRLHLYIGRVRARLFFGQRERAQMLTRHQFRQPLLFLLVRSKEQQRPNADGVMRVNKN